MIELDLKDYCQHGCMDFDAAVVKAQTYADEMAVYIRCVNAKRCEYMVRYLTNHAKENSQKN